MQIIKLSERQKELSVLVVAKKEVIQSDLDILKVELKAALSIVDEIRGRIKPLKVKLVPLAEMEASICCIKSRGKYFPEYAPDLRDQEFCESFFEKMASELKG